MDVVVDDKVTKTLDPKVKVVIENPGFKPVVGTKKNVVEISDKYSVFPSTDQIIADFIVPDSALEGVYGNMNNLNDALLAEIGNREAAIVGAHTYTNDTRTQIMTDVAASYIGNPAAGDAYILDSELSTKTITYNPTTGKPISATLADHLSKTVTLDGNVATQDSKILAHTTELGAQAAQISSLQVNSGDNSASLETVGKVLAGEFPKWVGPTLDSSNIGEIIYTTDGKTPVWNTNTTSDAVDINGTRYSIWQYLGIAAGWKDITNATGALAAASNLSIVNGKIAGWQYNNYGTTSNFEVIADNFKIYGSDANGTVNTAPFSVDTGANKIKMTANVDIAGSLSTGIIYSHDKSTYFDLDHNQIKMHNGTFTLDSTAAGTSSAPNIQGGYIKAGTGGMYIDMNNGEIYIP